jgi:hypothetical protein
MLVGVDQVVPKVKIITTLDQKRLTSTIPTLKASMATKLTKINDNKNLSKSTTTFMKTYVTEITIVIITRITEILVRPNNTQALGP